MFMLHLASSWCLTKSHILDTDRETNQKVELSPNWSA